jgi:hypothetical protein
VIASQLKRAAAGAGRSHVAHSGVLVVLKNENLQFGLDIKSMIFSGFDDFYRICARQTRLLWFFPARR